MSRGLDEVESAGFWGWRLGGLVKGRSGAQPVSGPAEGRP